MVWIRGFSFPLGTETKRQMKTTAETRPKMSIGFGNRVVSQSYAEADKHTRHADTNSTEITVRIAPCV